MPELEYLGFFPQAFCRRGIWSHKPTAEGSEFCSFNFNVRHCGSLWHLLSVLYITLFKIFLRLLYAKVILFLWIPKPPLKILHYVSSSSGLLLWKMEASRNCSVFCFLILENYLLLASDSNLRLFIYCFCFMFFSFLDQVLWRFLALFFLQLSLFAGLYLLGFLPFINSRLRQGTSPRTLDLLRVFPEDSSLAQPFFQTWLSSTAPCCPLLAVMLGRRWAYFSF